MPLYSPKSTVAAWRYALYLSLGWCEVSWVWNKPAYECTHSDDMEVSPESRSTKSYTMIRGIASQSTGKIHLTPIGSSVCISLPDPLVNSSLTIPEDTGHPLSTFV